MERLRERRRKEKMDEWANRYAWKAVLIYWQVTEKRIM